MSKDLWQLLAAELNFTGAIIDAFMIKHGQTDHLPPNSLYVTDDFEVSATPATHPPSS